MTNWRLHMHFFMKNKLVYIGTDILVFRNMYELIVRSDAENSRSSCFDWHNLIRTGIKYEILMHIILFGLVLLNLTCLFKQISASLVPYNASITSRESRKPSLLYNFLDECPVKARKGVGVS